MLVKTWGDGGMRRGEVEGPETGRLRVTDRMKDKSKKNGQRRGGKGGSQRPNTTRPTGPWYGAGKGEDITLCLGQYLSHWSFSKFSVEWPGGQWAKLGCCPQRF